MPTASGTQGEPPQPQPHRFRGLLLTAVSAGVGTAAYIGVQAVRQEYGWIAGSLAAFIVPGLVVWLVGKGIRRGKQLSAPAATTVLRTDPRPPVLYLRPFETDGVELTHAVFSVRTYEQVLARALVKVGPFVAVGSPREDARKPELGAARMYLRDETWQQHVDALVRVASLVVIHAGSSSGLTWECNGSLDGTGRSD